MIGLTGGIGAGKSTVARLLAEHGAHVIDSDELARGVIAPGTAGERDVIAALGPTVVGSDGHLDRQRCARLVFSDDQARARLEAIVHPLVRAAAAETIAAQPAGSVVVWEVPLLAETWHTRTDHSEFDLIVAVTAPLAQRQARLRARGMRSADIAHRIGAQAGDEQRAALADVVIDTSDGADTATAVAALWRQVHAR